jgi:4-amino-4-deoxy-L-arabinose transferase-like glycosyltransferase
MTRLHPPAPPLSPSWLPRRLQALCQRWPPFLRRRLAGRPLWLLAPLLPLLLSLAPRSPQAHDAGYYSLQAHWIAAGGPWLAPLWFGQPLFDRCIGAQWLMALALRLSGGQAWSLELPALLAALTSLVLSGWLAWRLLPGDPAGRAQRAALTVVLLALTPLWLNHSHLATQDMPLLAVELAGIAGLVASRRDGRGGSALVAGLAPGLAFLIKGFMVALPLLAIAPYLLLERRWLLRRPAFWLGVALGILPVVLWLALSLHSFGLPVVSGLWSKLLYLSRSDVFAAGPLYYLWNIPANTAPWCLAALAGWPLLWRGPLRRPERLLLLLYPLLLLLLLSGFRTKMPYYGLQLTPWIALAAAAALERWSAVARSRWHWIDRLIALPGALLLAAACLLLWPGSPLPSLLAGVEGLPPPLLLATAAAGLGLSWLLVPAQTSPRRRLLALLLGPWLALALLTQAGLFSDRSPGLRRSLETPAVAALLRQVPVQAAAAAPLSGEEHASLILLALATPGPPDQLLPPQAVRPGQRVWIRRRDLADPAAWRIRFTAPAPGGWVLADRDPSPAAAPP